MEKFWPVRIVVALWWLRQKGSEGRERLDRRGQTPTRIWAGLGGVKGDYTKVTDRWKLMSETMAYPQS